jgi:hypothetical protein
MARPEPSAESETPARQLAGFISKFEPPVARLIRAARAKLRKQFPAANELVYDNYNFLALGLSTTERSSDCFVALAASSKGVLLSFYYGAFLPDPDKLLLGSGNQHRYLRLDTIDLLDRGEVQALLTAALGNSDTPLPKGRRGRLLIKSVSEKQRGRRRERP